MAEVKFFKKLFSYLNRSGDILILFNNKGNISDINSEGASILGYAKSMLVGTSLMNIIAKADKDRVKNKLKDIYRGESYKGDIMLTDNKGSVKYVDCHISGETEEGLKVYYLLAHDNTNALMDRDRFQKLFEFNPLATVITRISDGEIIDFNKAYEELIGYKKQEVIGKTTIELGLYSMQTRKKVADEVIRSKGRLDNFNIDIKHKDGTVKKCLCSAEVINIQGEKYFMSVLDDETEKIDQQNALMESLIRMRLSSEAASVGTFSISLTEKLTRIINLLENYKDICFAYILDIKTGRYLCEYSKKEKPSDLPILVSKEQLEIINKHFSEGRTNNINGLSKEIKHILNPINAKRTNFSSVKIQGAQVALIGVLLCEDDVDWTKDDDQFVQTLGDIIANIYQRNHEEQLIREKALENEQAKMAVLNVLEDVESEKDKSEKLAKDLLKFELAVNQASDHIIITDSEGVIVYANDAVRDITGFEPIEIIGKTPGSLWGGLMPREFYEKFWHTIKVEKKTFKGEFTNKRKDGNEYIADATVSPIMNDRGEVMFFVGLERDITKIKEIDRMKTEFISIASHQLRTPLSAMKWYLELLINGDAGKLTPQQLDFVQNLNVSNERMIDLVNALLNVSRIESGRIIIEPHPARISDLVEGVINEVSERANEKSIKIKIDIAKGLPLVNMDTRLIRNALMNLLTNAIKYSPKGTKITVKVEKEKGREKEYVLFMVKDQGYGIPESDKDKVFSKFYRGKNIVKYDTNGNGIGLYLVKAVVNSSGGDVWFDSKVNVGTTFWFNLPIKGVPKKAGEVTLED